jgi:hypothetical protein
MPMSRTTRCKRLVRLLSAARKMAGVSHVDWIARARASELPGASKSTRAIAEHLVRKVVGTGSRRASESRRRCWPRGCLSETGRSVCGSVPEGELESLSERDALRGAGVSLKCL